MYKSNPLDTVCFDDGKIVLLNFHVHRTFEAFRFLNADVSLSEIEKIYQQIENDYAGKVTSADKLRIVFTNSPLLNYQCQIQKLEQMSSPIKMNSVTINYRLGPECAHKWDDQSRWIDLLTQKKVNCDDILLINTNYELIETSRFNVFCYDSKTDMALTPPLTSGCLSGVYRRFALSEGCISLPDIGTKKLLERTIKLDELAYCDLFVANSVRGVLKATLI